MNQDAWNSHNWSEVKGRKLEIEPGKPLIQHHCSRCGRDFVEDAQTRERSAVYVSVFSFRKLPEPISKRWLRELCPGDPLTDDLLVRSKLVETLRHTDSR
jgi:hypothetical protein